MYFIFWSKFFRVFNLSCITDRSQSDVQYQKGVFHKSLVFYSPHYDFFSWEFCSACYGRPHLSWSSVSWSWICSFEYFRVLAMGLRTSLGVFSNTARYRLSSAIDHFSYFPWAEYSVIDLLVGPDLIIWPIVTPETVQKKPAVSSKLVTLLNFSVSLRSDPGIQKAIVGTW